MRVIDNYEIVAGFVPVIDDGDAFVYTELLDRGRRKGNNGHRLVKTFYHRSREEFAEQMPVIRSLCELAKVRACTRLAPRSYKDVGRVFTRMVVDASLTDNWAGMKTLYNRALGTVTPTTKLWLFDVDLPDDASERFGSWLTKLDAHGDGKSALVATVPSKKGRHYITRPFDTRLLDRKVCPPNVSLHKDNPTNLYIPEGAD